MNGQERLMMLAEQGDEKAMLSLADMYYDAFKATSDYDSLGSAAKWYDNAGRRGSEQGVWMAMATYDVLASINSLQNVGEWELSKEYSLASIEWAQVILENFLLSDEEYRRLSNSLRCGYYNVGYCHYRLKEYHDALRAISDFEGISFELLQGVCLFSIRADHEMLVNAYQKLCMVENDMAYFSSKKSDDEEMIFTEAIMMLEFIYRKGLLNVVAPDLNRAVNILTRAESAVQNSLCKQTIQSSLCHYQKKLFGGYKYT